MSRSSGCGTTRELTRTRGFDRVVGAGAHAQRPRLRRLDAGGESGSLRIAVVAPPWIAVPPPGYGGIEAVVDLLCEGLVARGHDVTLYAAPGSRSRARVRTPLPAAHPDVIGSALHESDYVASVWREIDEAAELDHPFDVIHDHSGCTALAMADRVAVPMVHTLHGPFDADTGPFYLRHGHKAALAAISHSQAASAPDGVNVSAVVGNPIVVDDWPLGTVKADYLLWIGRFDPVKGAHDAIRAARAARRRLVLAGPVQTGQREYFREQIEPHIDGQAVRYVGVVGGATKQRLFAQAAALLMPIRWAEPFGMVMIEALACGTPVIAFREGAATEIVIHGENGLLTSDTAEMAAAIHEVGAIEPERCRASAAKRYDIAITTAAYERVYHQTVASDRRRSAVSLTVPGDPGQRADFGGVTALDPFTEPVLV